MNLRENLSHDIGFVIIMTIGIIGAVVVIIGAIYSLVQ
jgi:hypothetical protein